MAGVTAASFATGSAKKLAEPRPVLRFAHKIAAGGWAAQYFQRPTFWPPSQLSTGHMRRQGATSAILLVVVITATAGGCSRSGPPPRNDSVTASGAAHAVGNAFTPGEDLTQNAQVRGGAAVAAIRTEPRSFNRLVARDTVTELVTNFTQAKLVRVNKLTQDLEPWLAEHWTQAADGRHYTLALRQGVTFSDGHPFTADDVVFSFQAANDSKTQSPLADILTIGGKPIQVVAQDSHTVELAFPSAFAPGLRLLDNLPILPRHKLESALKQGTLGSAWGLSTPPAEITGLGPFVVEQYIPGQRLVFTRNARYWRRDAHGTALPYLDRLTLEIIPDQNAQALRLQTGQLDITTSEIAPEDYVATKRAADEGKLKFYDLGVALVADSLWLNLKPGAFGGDARAAWLQRDELRRAISMAVDRRRFADTVFYGAGEPVDGPETRSNKKWFSPGTAGDGARSGADAAFTPYDPAGAQNLLASIGLVDRDREGVLKDANHLPVRFTLITQAGRPRLERGAAVIRQDLRKIGIVMDVAALDGNALVEHLVSAKYDAVYFNPQPTDTDPGANPDFWFSWGSAHLWNMAQAKPATDWERQIDDLMAKQIASPDENERRVIFADVLRIFHEHQPVLYFAAPKVFVAVSSRIMLTPALDPWPALWSPDTISVVSR
jgi:peptide/nickel transport system substrate-binding protein